jgi:hypothetical protein
VDRNGQAGGQRREGYCSVEGRLLAGEVARRALKGEPGGLTAVVVGALQGVSSNERR